MISKLHLLLLSQIYLTMYHPCRKLHVLHLEPFFAITFILFLSRIIFHIRSYDTLLVKLFSNSFSIKCTWTWKKVHEKFVTFECFLLVLLMWKSNSPGSKVVLIITDLICSVRSLDRSSTVVGNVKSLINLRQPWRCCIPISPIFVLQSKLTPYFERTLLYAIVYKLSESTIFIYNVIITS